MPKGHIPGTRAVLVSLREITSETVRQITRLSVSPEQQRFVASNAISLAEALFSPNAWYRAIYAGESPAGFVMLYDESLRTTPPPNHRRHCGASWLIRDFKAKVLALLPSSKSLLTYGARVCSPRFLFPTFPLLAVRRSFTFALALGTLEGSMAAKLFWSFH